MEVNGAYDVIIVGGGPAGLSAALVLGRARRRVLVCDAGNPRNAKSGGLHGYLSRDGILPGDFLAIGRKELDAYGVELRSCGVLDVKPVDGGFEANLGDGAQCRSRRILFATGVVDQVPDIPGFREFYGRGGVHHCPYCDGWEARDRPIGVYGLGKNGVAVALALKSWSSDVTLFTNGRSRLEPRYRTRLDAHGIQVRSEKIARVEGSGGRLERVVLEGGDAVPCGALFFSTGNVQRSELPERLGCRFTKKGALEASRFGQHSTVCGVFVAGDAAEEAHFVVIAAAEGAKAAMAIHKELQKDEGLILD